MSFVSLSASSIECFGPETIIGSRILYVTLSIPFATPFADPTLGLNFVVRFVASHRGNTSPLPIDRAVFASVVPLLK